MAKDAYKIVMVGDSGVGKSSMLLRYARNQFDEDGMGATIGVDYHTKQYTAQSGEKIKLHFWDTAGQERFRSMSQSYYRGVDAVVMVYDVANRESFDSLVVTWSKEVELWAHGERYAILLVANKYDEQCHAVTIREGLEYAESINAQFFECSARSNHQITDAFESLVEDLMSRQPRRRRIKLNAETSRSSTCVC
jgi:Ras-related protein Rab-18